MDNVQRDTMFAGLSDREIAEAIIVEMRRRGLLGCVFMFPEGPMINGVFGSSAPAGTLTGFTASEQLRVFADVAALSPGERVSRIEAPDDTNFDPGKWVH